MIEETNLRVAEAYHKDVGRGIARIDTRLMQQIGLVSGDIIEISGRTKTYALGLMTGSLSGKSRQNMLRELPLLLPSL